MIEVAVLSQLAPLLERLKLHPPKKCTWPKCDHGPVEAQLGYLDHLDRYQSPLPNAAVYACRCNETRTEALRVDRRKIPRVPLQEADAWADGEPR